MGSLHRAYNGTGRDLDSWIYKAGGLPLCRMLCCSDERCEKNNDWPHIVLVAVQGVYDCQSLVAVQGVYVECQNVALDSATYIPLVPGFSMSNIPSHQP